MSQDPNDVLRVLHRASDTGGNLVLAAEDATWLLAQLKHRDDRIAALSALVKPTPVAVAATPEETVCQEADRITSTSRQADYGHPIFNMTRIARIWEVILDRPAGEITPEQVGLCMIGTKLARECYKPKRDNLVDIAGYAKVVQTCRDYQP